MTKGMIWDGSLDPDKLTGKHLLFREKAEAKEARRTLSEAGLRHITAGGMVFILFLFMITFLPPQGIQMAFSSRTMHWPPESGVNLGKNRIVGVKMTFSLCWLMSISVVTIRMSSVLFREKGLDMVTERTICTCHPRSSGIAIWNSASML